MAQLQTISFNEIKPGATVRILMEEPPLIYAVDIVMVVTGKNNDDANKALRNIPEYLYRQERFAYRNPPSGGRPARFVAYEDALELVMALGGKEANIMKTQFAKILTRYFAGDSSMHAELEANSTSTASINVLARASETVGSKRSRESGQVLQEVHHTMEQVMEVSNAFGANLAQQKSDVADTYDLYVKMAKLQQDMASSQCSVETARQTTFAMELKTAEGKAAIAAEQKERELVHMGKLGAIEAEQKRILSEMEAEQKRKQNEEELCFLQRKQELLVAPPEAKPKKMVQTKLDFFGKKKEDMKTYSELFVEVAKGTAPPETFGPTAKHVAELYEQTFKTQPVKLGRHHMYHKDHFDIIKKWTLEFELLLQFLQQKASY